MLPLQSNGKELIRAQEQIFIDTVIAPSLHLLSASFSPFLFFCFLLEGTHDQNKYPQNILEFVSSHLQFSIVGKHSRNWIHVKLCQLTTGRSPAHLESEDFLAKKGGEGGGLCPHFSLSLASLSVADRSQIRRLKWETRQIEAFASLILQEALAGEQVPKVSDPPSHLPFIRTQMSNFTI